MPALSEMEKYEMTRIERNKNTDLLYILIGPGQNWAKLDP